METIELKPFASYWVPFLSVFYLKPIFITSLQTLWNPYCLLNKCGISQETLTLANNTDI